MRIILCTVVLSGLLLTASVLRAQEVEILMTGEIHKDQLTAQAGEEWFGLFMEGDTCRLVRTRIQVTPTEWLEDKNGERTGRLVSCDHPGKPVFLVRGIEGLEEREFITQFHGKKFFFPGQSLKLDAIKLVAFGEYQKKPPFGPVLDNYSIEYTAWPRRNEYHVLATYGGIPVEEELPNLIWAGDLDNDGWADMLWDLSPKYSYRLYTLFLCSLAGDRETVTKVAELKIQLPT